MAIIGVGVYISCWLIQKVQKSHIDFASFVRRPLKGKVQIEGNRRTKTILGNMEHMKKTFWSNRKGPFYFRGTIKGVEHVICYVIDFIVSTLWPRPYCSLYPIR